MRSTCCAFRHSSLENLHAGKHSELSEAKMRQNSRKNLEGLGVLGMYPANPTFLWLHDFKFSLVQGYSLGVNFGVLVALINRLTL